jgi:hypothetical protein
MPAPPIAEEISVKFKAAIEKRLRAGYSPQGVAGGKGSSVQWAAKDIPVDQRRLSSWVRRQKLNTENGKKSFSPDWTLWNRSATSISRGHIMPPARRWLVTAAQNDTPVHDRFWQNLKAYAAFVGAEILVGPFTYQLGTFTDHTTRNNVFAEAVRSHLRFERVECGDVLFCAEMNTLPTAERPLSGLHTYTRGQWGVFPHAKVALETVPAMPGKMPPVIMTTGCCTVENYIPKKAGLKAAFHHVIGATLIEIDPQGRHFCRQINAVEDGSFQDLDHAVSAGKVTAGHRVAAITWGDVHRSVLEQGAARAAWGLDAATLAPVSETSMLDDLRPFDQFFHDLFHGAAINHWQEDKHLERYPLHVAGKLNVAAEVVGCSQFLRATERQWCRSHVVESNHDYWILRWLQRADPRKDLTNAEAFYRWNLAAMEAGRLGDETFSIFRHVLKEADSRNLEGINFIPIGSSFEICRDRGGIECGLHGHLGSNGTRGTTSNLARVAIKINKGHDHTATIHDGVYSAGANGDDPALKKGPSSHSASDIIVYPNSKRTIITKHGDRYRA